MVFLNVRDISESVRINELNFFLSQTFNESINIKLIVNLHFVHSEKHFYFRI